MARRLSPLGAAGAGAPRTYVLGTRPRGGPRRLDNALIAIGAVLILLGLGLFAYPRWAEWQHHSRRPAGPQEDLPARLLASASEPGGPAWGVVPSGAAGAPPAAPVSRPLWMLIPRIGVDSSVMEMEAQGGEYQVPSFDVGHHADSARPGEVGNQIYDGHLFTIDAGQVFARLKELAAGDAVYVYTATHRFDWVVEDAHTVETSARDFLLPTADTRLTLYTCDGTLDLRTRDYTHRRVVVGRLVQVTPRVGQVDYQAPSTSERNHLQP
jgi:LPXTG-site transpeptidase (sortase) family protein